MIHKYKFILFAVLLGLTFSCQLEKDPVIKANGLTLSSTGVVPAALTLPTATDNIAEFAWTVADNGLPTVSKYSIVVSYKDPITNIESKAEYSGNKVVVTPTFRKCNLTVGEFNDLLNKLTNFNCGIMNVVVRAKASVGDNNSYENFSNPLNFSVQGYSTKPQQLAFVKTGDTPANSMLLKSSRYTKSNDFEGYAYLTAGTYKLYKPDPCGGFTGAAIFGQTSATNAALIANGVDITIATAGHYKIAVDLVANTFTKTLYTAIGAYGRATRGGISFSQTVPFEYSNLKKEWTGTLNLLTGQSFKIKALQYTGPLVTPDAVAPQPKPDFAPLSATNVTLFGAGVADGALAEAGNGIIVSGVISTTVTEKYEITINVSNPRNYTYKLNKI